MKNKTLSIVLLALALASCGVSPSSLPSANSSTSSAHDSTSSISSVSSTESEDNAFVDPASKTYVNRIDEPSSAVTSSFALSQRLDYAAFYHLPSIDATLNYSFSSVSDEMKKAYWASKLLPCVVDPKLASSNGSTITVSFTYYREGTKHYTNEFYSHMESLLPGLLIDEANKRADDFSAFPYTERAKTADVVSTQQLMYALEFGYCPLPLEGTPAASALQQCQAILRRIVNDSMNDVAKYAAIYSYCGAHLCYDFVGDRYVGYYSKSSAPNALAATDDGFFLDGALRGYAVCEGWTKLFTVLATMEGLTCYNASGFPISFDYSKSVYSVSNGSWNTHAYNYAEMKGRYYVIDASWSQLGYADGYPLGWSYFFVSKTNHEGMSQYTDATYLPSGVTVATTEFDVFNAMSFSYDNGPVYPFVYASGAALNSLLLYFYQGVKSGYYPSSVGWSAVVDCTGSTSYVIEEALRPAVANLKTVTGDSVNVSLLQTISRGSTSYAILYIDA